MIRLRVLRVATICVCATPAVMLLTVVSRCILPTMLRTMTISNGSALAYIPQPLPAGWVLVPFARVLGVASLLLLFPGMRPSNSWMKVYCWSWCATIVLLMVRRGL